MKGYNPGERRQTWKKIPIFIQVLSLSKLFEPQCWKGGQAQSRSFTELKMQKSRFKVIDGSWDLGATVRSTENETQRLAC